MFKQNLKYRNLFLRVNCPNFNPISLNDGMNLILLQHLSVPNVYRQQLLVNDCKTFFQRKFSHAYGEKGFIDAVIDIYSNFLHYATISS